MASLHMYLFIIPITDMITRSLHYNKSGLQRNGLWSPVTTEKLPLVTTMSREDIAYILVQILIVIDSSL